MNKPPKKQRPKFSFAPWGLARFLPSPGQAGQRSPFTVAIVPRSQQSQGNHMKKLKPRGSTLRKSSDIHGLTQPSTRPAIGGLSLGFVFSFQLWILSLALLLLSQPSTLHSQPSPPPNRVLDLDGTGDYVRLPGFVFTNLSQA